jgi:hypothetical protein
MTRSGPRRPERRAVPANETIPGMHGYLVAADDSLQQGTKHDHPA